MGVQNSNLLFLIFREQLYFLSKYFHNRVKEVFLAPSFGLNHAEDCYDASA